MSIGEYFDIGGQALQNMVNKGENTAAYEMRKAFVLWREDIDNFIMDEIIEMCQEHGITDLYVLNRNFILAAIREKIERGAQP